MIKSKLKYRINIFMVPAKNGWLVLKISRNLRLARNKKASQQNNSNNIYLK